MVSSTTVSEGIGFPKQVGDLELNPADEGYIIYQPDQDRVHYLNPTAVFILELCDGSRPLGEIVELVKEAYGLAESPADMVAEAVAKMRDEGLLQ